jgi:preprotein translocase SecE subunit
MTSRIGILCLLVLAGLYSGVSWHGAFYAVGASAAHGGALALGGGVALPLLFVAVGVFVTLVQPRTSDFLIDMDSELRKVVWPDTQPVFDPKAEAWGATYVVIITVIVFAVFIFLVDKVLEYALQNSLFPVLFST